MIVILPKHSKDEEISEKWSHIFGTMDKFGNPKRGVREIIEDPGLDTLFVLAAVPVGYVAMSIAMGAEGFMTQHLVTIGVESGIINPVTLALTAAVVSADVQLDTWEDIGDPMTGAVHYSGAGMMSGGSMPVVPAGWLNLRQSNFWGSMFGSGSSNQGEQSGDPRYRGYR